MMLHMRLRPYDESMLPAVFPFQKILIDILFEENPDSTQYLKIANGHNPELLQRNPYLIEYKQSTLFLPDLELIGVQVWILPSLRELFSTGT